MANDKMTIAKAMDYILNTYGDTLPVDVAEKCKGIKAQAQKKAKADRLPTAEQKENAELREKMVTLLYGKTMSCSEVADKFGISVHKAAALLGQLVRENRVIRSEVKRKAYFSIPAYPEQD